MKRFAGLVLAALGVAVSAVAQGPAAPESLAADPALVVAPSSGAVYTPMSAHERWHGYLHENLLSSKFGFQLFGSAFISHLDRDPVEWGLRSHGYFRRVENRFLTTSIDGAIHSSLAAAFHHDTRYWRYRGNGHGLQRAGHALVRTLLTYDESGHRPFDMSAMLGIYGSSMLSTYWHARADALGQGVRAGNAGVIAQAGANLVKEFGPDLKHLFAKKQ
jgi:hypothetical protein